jgi:hypothetical protein
MSVESDELDALMARVKAEKETHDPKSEFTDEEMAGLFLIANQPLDYWLHIAKNEEEPENDFGLRNKLDQIKSLDEDNLCSANELLGPKEPTTKKNFKKPPCESGGFIDKW